ncbi:MAG TPA: RNA pseudouridine synthase [Cytophagales bacterium]|nr:RNA pseudouridine synthase [Cytophagales bacterium]
MTQNPEIQPDFFDEKEDELFEHYRFVADKGQSAIRLDKFLMDRIQNSTRSRIQAAIEAGSVQLNDKPTKNSYKIKPNDVVKVLLSQPPREDVVLPENIPLEILYEDDDLLVVNKPAGMVVHPAYNNYNGTLVNALAYHFQNLPTGRNGTGRPGLVHRIDKDTSGLLVIAKTEYAMAHLAKQFFDHSIERTYIAVVWGQPDSIEGTVNVHLGRSEKDRRVVAAYPDASQGKNAITHYKVLKPMYYVSMIQCNLETGRTHQIRAHMKYIGHPLFNDETYGGNKIVKGTTFAKYAQFVENCFKIMPRQALHAKSLGFIHPSTKKYMQFESPLPAEFTQLVEKWEKYLEANG